MVREFNFKEELKKQEKANAGSLYLDEVLRDFDEFIKRLKEELRNCDEFFNVKDYNDVVITDKFMGIVELFLNKLAGDKLNEKTN